jgi:hypothetical protein
MLGGLPLPGGSLALPLHLALPMGGVPGALSAVLPAQPAESNGSRQGMMREVLGKRGFAAVRAIMLRQQSTFVQQLFELHKVHSLQKLMWAELQADIEMPMASTGAAPLSLQEAAVSSGRGPTRPAQSEQHVSSISAATPSAGPAPACVQHAAAASPARQQPKQTAQGAQGNAGEPSVSLDPQQAQRFQNDIQMLLNVPSSLRRQLHLQRTHSGAFSSGPAPSGSAATGPAMVDAPARRAGVPDLCNTQSVSSAGLACPSPGPNAVRPVPTRLRMYHSAAPAASDADDMGPALSVQQSAQQHPVPSVRQHKSGNDQADSGTCPKVSIRPSPRHLHLLHGI